MIHVNNFICLHCAHSFSTLKSEKEIVRCPLCGSTKLGKKEYMKTFPSLYYQRNKFVLIFGEDLINDC